VLRSSEIKPLFHRFVTLWHVFFLQTNCVRAYQWTRSFFKNLFVYGRTNLLVVLISHAPLDTFSVYVLCTDVPIRIFILPFVYGRTTPPVCFTLCVRTYHTTCPFYPLCTDVPYHLPVLPFLYGRTNPHLPITLCVRTYHSTCLFYPLCTGVPYHLSVLPFV